MKLSIILSLIFGLLSLHASTMEDISLLMKNKKMSIYGVKNKDKNTSNGVGIFYNTQNLKVKIEGSEAAIKTGAVLTYNPPIASTYINIGANYINQNMQNNNFINNNFNQYSSAVAVGYMLYNDLYVELGKNISRLDSVQSSQDTRASSQIIKNTYTQIGKRFETPIGMIDTHLNSSQIYNTLSKKEDNYGTSFNYYLDNTANIGYFYNTSLDVIHTGYSMNLSYFTTQYTKNITQDSYNVTVGIKANFTDITDLSTYNPLTKAKKRLAGTQKFDNLILHNNMRLRR